MRLPLLLACLFWALGSCAGRTGPLADGGATEALPPVVREARARIRAHQVGEALEVLQSSRGLSAVEPERSWLLVHLEAQRCGHAHLRRETEALPDGPVADALRALTAEDAEAGLVILSRRLRARGGPWVHLAAAVLRVRLGDKDVAVVEAGHALTGAPVFVRIEALLLRARLHVDAGRLDLARDDALAAGALESSDSRPTALLAEIARRAGRPRDAALELARALRQDPLSETYARGLADLLREHVEEGAGAAVERALGALDLRGNPEGVALEGLLAEQVGRASEAVDLYRRALEGGASPVPVDRHLRRLLAGSGRYQEAAGLLFAAVPPDVLADPLNTRRLAWAALRSAVGSAPDASSSPAARLALARALVGVGALREARSVLEGLDASEARSLDGALSGEILFEEALRDRLEEGYRAALRKEDVADFGAVLGDVRELALLHLVPADHEAFRDPGRGRRDVPLLGTWLDHSTRTTSPIVEHFRRYGKFLMLGQRGGLPPEAILLSLASLTDRQPIVTRGHRFTQDVAVGYDRELRSFLDASGGSLGGASLADGVWLDADSARRSEHDLRRAVFRDPSLLHAARDAPAPDADGVEGPFSLSDPACVGVRLLGRYLDRNPAGGWGGFGTLRVHEFGHVFDIRRHLPIMKSLPATISMFARAGFSSTRVEMGLEGRAQLAAAIDAPDPDLALAEMALSLPVDERVPEVHDGGYRDALLALVHHVYSRPDLFPEIDRAKRILPQLDRLTNDEIRAAARAVLR